MLSNEHIHCLIWLLKQKSFLYLSATPIMWSRSVHPQRKNKYNEKKFDILMLKLNHRGSDPLGKQKLFSFCLENNRLKTEVVLLVVETGFFVFVGNQKLMMKHLREPNLGAVKKCSTDAVIRRVLSLLITASALQFSILQWPTTLYRIFFLYYTLIERVCLFLQ